MLSKGNLPFHEHIESLPFVILLSIRSTLPPAASTKSFPAAISHKLITSSIYASRRPHALLGAVGLPDIGHFFPPTDESIKGISSLEILSRVAFELNELGAVIVNLDSTLIAEKPKILPYADEMKENISQSLGIDPKLIGIKATTNEQLGFLGREEGMAAMAVASVEL